MHESNKPAIDSYTKQAQQNKTLKIALCINILMFVIEFRAGLLVSSTALLADSLDMLGDSLIYGFSIYVISQSNYHKAISALMKGCIMAIFGLFVLGQAINKIINPVVPNYETIGLIGIIALLANIICFILLCKHRKDDVNMRSVWLCSRNDIIANLSVILSAIGVAITGTQWPDLLAGMGIASLFLFSSFFILKDAISNLAESENAPSFILLIHQKIIRIQQ